MKNDDDQETFLDASLAGPNGTKGQDKKETERKDEGYKESSMRNWKIILLRVMSFAAVIFGTIFFVQNKKSFSFHRMVVFEIPFLSRDLKLEASWQGSWEVSEPFTVSSDGWKVTHFKYSEMDKLKRAASLEKIFALQKKDFAAWKSQVRDMDEQEF